MGNSEAALHLPSGNFHGLYLDSFPYFFTGLQHFDRPIQREVCEETWNREFSGAEEILNLNFEWWRWISVQDCCGRCSGSLVFCWSGGQSASSCPGSTLCWSRGGSALSHVSRCARAFYKSSSFQFSLPRIWSRWNRVAEDRKSTKHAKRNWRP